VTSSESRADVDEREREVGQAALEVLTKQFKNRFDFIRELVQNALDAGTPTVEVWVDFIPTGGELGVCQVHVDDFGEGMNEHIIDNQLTRLFSSTKEDDLTKIGKFGIGFVSVFSIEPEGVMIHTSRGGENWEVFFHGDGTFEKSTMDQPVDGTKITVFKSMTRREFEKSAESIFETVKFWCRHADKKIYFRDCSKQKAAGAAVEHPFAGRFLRGGDEGGRVLVNEPLGVEGFCEIHAVEGGTEVAMAFSDKPSYGFYNKGLTLCESSATEVVAGYEKFFCFVSFKIKSHYLEHTLTRDTILRDVNYFKALGILIERARQDLVMALLQGIETRAGRKDLSAEDLAWYMDAMSWLYLLPRELDPTFTFAGKVGDVKHNVGRVLLFSFSSPTEKSIDADEMKLFRPCHGKGVTMKRLEAAVKRNRGILWRSSGETPLTQLLKEEGITVFLLPWWGQDLSFFDKHIKTLGGELKEFNWPPVALVDDYFWIVSRCKADALDPRERKMTSEIGRLLGDLKFPMKALAVADFSHYRPVEKRMSCRVKHGSSLGCCLEGYIRAREWDLVIDRGDAVFRALLDLYDRDRGLALTIALQTVLAETGTCLELLPQAMQRIYSGRKPEGSGS
jgi:hypothetical protein